MENALHSLSTTGTAGAILAVVFALLAATIGVLAWALKRLVDAAIKQQDKFSDFMDALTKSLTAIGFNCQACRSDSVATLRDLEGTVKAEVQHVVWAAHDKAKLETDASIDHAVERLEESFTGAANSIRAAIEKQHLQDRVDELSRPHDVDGAVRR
jgi:nitrate reductase gamma subunit